MSSKGGSDVARFYDTVAADYHRMYQRENLASLDRYPANYFRLQIGRPWEPIHAERLFQLAPQLRPLPVRLGAGAGVTYGTERFAPLTLHAREQGCLQGFDVGLAKRADRTLVILRSANSGEQQ